MLKTFFIKKICSLLRLKKGNNIITIYYMLFFKSNLPRLSKKYKHQINDIENHQNKY